MELFLGLALAVFIAGGLCATVFSRFESLAIALGAAALVVGSVLGGVAAVDVLANGALPVITLASSPVFGAMTMHLDRLSAFFVLLLFIISPIVAIYGVGYDRGHSHGLGRSIALSWLWLNILVASLLLVFTAASGWLFLLAWELMTLSSFFLVVRDGTREASFAGWMYLVASHIGTAFIIVLFLLLAKDAGSYQFSAYREVLASGVISTNLVFVLALVGFGTKAGLIPLHVWLPEAHPAAPSHVSALMSGVMIKAGIYGIARFLMLIGTPAVWWANTLIGIGLVSGIVGILFSIAQHDLKRMLAYSSVENVGIITVGFGCGVLGICTGQPFLAGLGFVGGLWHVLNHALFKTLLFMAGGSAVWATGTRDMNRLGGLIKRMPWTGVAFIVGAIAVCGLPPFNGFISELLVYVSAFKQLMAAHGFEAIPGAAVLAGLAVIGGLAVAGFTKVFGMVFLGEARTDDCRMARDPSLWMEVSMGILAFCCLVVALGAPWVFRFVCTVVQESFVMTAVAGEAGYDAMQDGLSVFVLVTVVFLFLVAALLGLQRCLLKNRNVGTAGTWDCGYAQPTERMQYTASSFSDPIVLLFESLLRTKRREHEVEGLFPAAGWVNTETPDVVAERGYRPLFRFVERISIMFQRMQDGRVHTYVMYIMFVVTVLLIWKLGV